MGPPDVRFPRPLPLACAAPDVSNRLRRGLATLACMSTNAIRVNPQTRPAASARILLSAHCSLKRTPKTIDGGGTWFIEDNYGTKSVKLPAGHCGALPSTSLHQVTPVSPVAHASHRFSLGAVDGRDGDPARILFDLDQSIQELSASAGPERPDRRCA